VEGPDRLAERGSGTDVGDSVVLSLEGSGLERIKLWLAFIAHGGIVLLLIAGGGIMLGSSTGSAGDLESGPPADELFDGMESIAQLVTAGLAVAAVLLVVVGFATWRRTGSRGVIVAIDLLIALMVAYLILLGITAGAPLAPTLVVLCLVAGGTVTPIKG